MCSKHVEC